MVLMAFDPILAGFDKPVLIKLGDICLDQVNLLAGDPQQALQGIALIRIAQPVDGRQRVDRG
jgi:hypothetical protein